MFNKFWSWVKNLFKDQDKPVEKPPVKVITAEPSEQGGDSVGVQYPKDLLTDLVKTYKETGIEFDNLKPITLAQWLLESGRATSQLATRHYNFAGLKWRKEMKKVKGAESVTYEAHDGVDEYCQFDSLESFIKGYWVFLNRSVYSGW